VQYSAMTAKACLHGRDGSKHQDPGARRRRRAPAQLRPELLQSEGVLSIASTGKDRRPEARDAGYRVEGR